MTISTKFTKDTAAKIAETIDARGAVYAPPESNFKRIADFWSMWIKWRYGVDVPLSAFDAGMMQAGIKLARQAETPFHEDSALDGPAYWMLAVGCDHDARMQAQGDAEAPAANTVRTTVGPNSATISVEPEASPTFEEYAFPGWYLPSCTCNDCDEQRALAAADAG